MSANRLLKVGALTVFLWALLAVSPASAASVEEKPTNVECTWIGERILLLLAREDVVTAENFFRLYETFGCPKPHLGKAFGCIVTGGVTEKPNEIEEKAKTCWRTPSTKFLSGTPGAPAKSDRGAKPEAGAPAKSGAGTRPDAGTKSEAGTRPEAGASAKPQTPPRPDKTP